jgi:hypothetical protein
MTERKRFVFLFIFYIFYIAMRDKRIKFTENKINEKLTRVSNIGCEADIHLL